MTTKTDPREWVLRGLITKELGRVSLGIGEFLTLSVTHLPPLGRAAGAANLALMRASLEALRALPTAPILGHYKHEEATPKRPPKRRGSS